MHNRFWLKVGKIKDKKLWLFDLCRDARWSNGELVITYDVVYSWRRLANPTTDSPMTSVLTHRVAMRNAKAILSGKASLDSLVGGSCFR